MKNTQPINIGVIGYGYRGRELAGLLAENPQYRLSAICDRQSEYSSLLKRSEPMKQVGFYTDFRKILENKELEAVVIAVPQYAHHSLALEAFRAGKHVYTEKPMALSIRECDEMIAAAEKAGKVLMVGQQMRYHAHLLKMKEVVDSGELGKPVMIWLTEFRDPFHGEWAYDKKKSGGLLVEKNCHHTDFFNWMAGASPVSVYASGGQDVVKKTAAGKSGILDNAWVTVNYSNGARAMLGICMFSSTAFEKTHYQVGYHRREMGVACERGVICSEGPLGRNLEVQCSNTRNKTIYQLDVNQCISSHGILNGFYAAVRDRKKPSATGEIGRAALAVSLAAEKSIEEKRLVQISEILDMNAN